MATAEQFERAATMLATAIDEVAGGARHLIAVREADALQGGRIDELVTTALRVGEATAADVGAELDGLVRLCRWRASVCADHARALDLWVDRHRDWQRASVAVDLAGPDSGAVAPGPPPARPTAPYHWVDPR